MVTDNTSGFRVWRGYRKVFGYGGVEEGEGGSGVIIAIVSGRNGLPFSTEDEGPGGLSESDVGKSE